METLDHADYRVWLHFFFWPTTLCREGEKTILNWLHIFQFAFADSGKRTLAASKCAIHYSIASQQEKVKNVCITISSIKVIGLIAHRWQHKSQIRPVSFRLGTNFLEWVLPPYVGITSDGTWLLASGFLTTWGKTCWHDFWSSKRPIRAFTEKAAF